jgi:hypothetical protein
MNNVEARTLRRTIINLQFKTYNLQFIKDVK